MTDPKEIQEGSCTLKCLEKRSKQNDDYDAYMRLNLRWWFRAITPIKKIGCNCDRIPITPGLSDEP